MRGSARQARTGTAIAVLSLVMAAAVDIWTGPMAVLIGLMIVGPLVASLRSTLRDASVIVAVSVVAAFFLGIPDGIFLTTDHLIRVAIVALAGVLCLRVVWERAQREDVTRRLAEVAEVAQEAILRPPPAALADVKLAARYVSASEESQVGGDLYETAFTPSGVRVIVGDVRGKGLDAVQVAASVLGAFREVVWDRSVVNVARSLDERITKIAADEEEFVTAVLVEVPHDPLVRIVNAGHHPPLRLSAKGAEFLEPRDPSLPLGMGPDLEMEQFTFEVGDRIFLYTDGLVEARDREGRFFPLLEHTDALRAPSLQDALDALLGRLNDHLPERTHDDVAVFLIERQDPVD